MLTTVHFHKSLQKYTGVEKHSLNVSSYADLIQSCVNLFPKLRKAFQSISNNNSYSEEVTIVVGNRILTKDELYFKPHRKNKITFCPVIYGTGSNGALIGIIVIIIILVIITIVSLGSAAPATGPGIAGAVASATAVEAGTIAAAAAASAAATTQVAILAVTVAASIAAQIFKPKLKPAGKVAAADAAQRTNNELFGPLNTSSGQGHAVQLNYGLIRVPGHFISGYIDIIEHDKNADISVIERFA